MKMKILSLFSGAGGLDLGFKMAGHDIVWANDFRIAREYLLFLSNYGYLCKSDARKREEEEYHININIFAEIEEIIHEQPKEESLLKALDQIMFDVLSIVVFLAGHPNEH